MENIRKASLDDHPTIIDIYNQAVEAGFQTADTEKVTYEEALNWMRGHLKDPHPVFVFTIDDQVAGWLSISAYRPGRKALRFTKEVSSYVHKNYRARGIGSKLLEHAIEYCRQQSIRNIFAILLDCNKASVRTLEKYGFSRWAHLPEVADFDGQVVGQYYYGKKVDD
ncbi:MAG: GNAT family N-acetyltransferase [Bacteroidales bacterium]|nr:GNAT family N-acetyltransferase [Bacteroidales bacterium]